MYKKLLPYLWVQIALFLIASSSSADNSYPYDSSYSTDVKTLVITTSIDGNSRIWLPSRGIHSSDASLIREEGRKLLTNYADFIEEQSYGRTRIVGTRVIGPIDFDSSICTGTYAHDVNAFRNSILAAAYYDGHIESGMQVLIVHPWDKGSCANFSNNGHRHTVQLHNGESIWVRLAHQNGFGAGLAHHELGHTLGARHMHNVYCRDESGNHTPISYDCVVHWYCPDGTDSLTGSYGCGAPGIDIMYSRSNLPADTGYSLLNKMLMGWIYPAEVQTGFEGTYMLGSMEDAQSQLKGIHISLPEELYDIYLVHRLGGGVVAEATATKHFNDYSGEWEPLSYVSPKLVVPSAEALNAMKDGSQPVPYLEIGKRYFFGTNGHSVTVNYSNSTGAVVELDWIEQVWHNRGIAQDVNGNGAVTVLDAHLILGYIGRSGEGPVPFRTDDLLPYYDVNGDGQITVADALAVINYIASQTYSSGGYGYYSY